MFPVRCAENPHDDRLHRHDDRLHRHDDRLHTGWTAHLRATKTVVTGMKTVVMEKSRRKPEN